jgi:hypothetical protein
MILALSILGTILAVLGLVVSLGVLVEFVHVIVRIIGMGLDDAAEWFYTNHNKGIGAALKVFMYGDKAQKAMVIGGGALGVILSAICVFIFVQLLFKFKWVVLIWGLICLILAGATFYTVRRIAINGYGEILKLLKLYRDHGKNAWETITKGDSK